MVHAWVMWLFVLLCYRCTAPTAMHAQSVRAPSFPCALPATTVTMGSDTRVCQDGEPALFLACRLGRLPVVKALLAAGAKVDATGAVSEGRAWVGRVWETRLGTLHTYTHTYRLAPATHAHARLSHGIITHAHTHTPGRLHRPAPRRGVGAHGRRPHPAGGRRKAGRPRQGERAWAGRLSASSVGLA